jgi:hypothetical protein
LIGEIVIRNNYIKQLQVEIESITGTLDVSSKRSPESAADLRGKYTYNMFWKRE